MAVIKFVRMVVAFFIISGPLSTMPFINSVRISTPVSSSDGRTFTIFAASSVMIDAAAGSRRGRLSVIAPSMEETICEPVSTMVGRTSFSFSEICPIPSLIFPTPPSVSPEKMEVNPSITVVIPGRNSAIILFFRPLKDWRLSVKAAAAFTSSSSITIPRSCACCFMASISSADMFSKAPISVAPFPKSSCAIRARSVSSSTPARAVMVLFQSSSRLMFCASSAEIPSSSKAADPLSAAVESFVIDVFRLSMLVPLCCAMKSHSWYASVLIPSFWDILSIWSPYSAVAFAALTKAVDKAPTDATAAVTPAAIVFAPDLIALENFEENFSPEVLPAFSAAVLVVEVISFVIVCCAPFMVGMIVTDACATSIMTIHLLLFSFLPFRPFPVKERPQFGDRQRVFSDVLFPVVPGSFVWSRLSCLFPGAYCADICIY